jgi:hypothetical protein
MNPNEFPPELPPDAAPDEVPPQPVKKKKRHGCLWALLICFVLMIVLAVTGLLVVRSLWKSAVRTYTATAPVPIPVLETSKEEAKAISDRAKKFFEDLQAGKLVEPLTLTAEDLNRLIAASGSNQLAGKLFVTIADGKVKGRMSFSLDKTGRADLMGRWLNADVTLRATLEGGELRVVAEEIAANDKSIPGIVLNQLKQRNLADEFMNNQDTYAALQLLDSITVTNDAIVVTPKP